MHMTDLASASGIYGSLREQSEALLLEAGISGSESFGVLLSCILKSVSEGLVHLSTARLVELTLWCDSGYSWARTVAFGEPGLSALIVADWRIDWFRECSRRVGIRKGEESQICDLEVAEKS